jgi:hypothetical protein
VCVDCGEVLNFNLTVSIDCHVGKMTNANMFSQGYLLPPAARVVKVETNGLADPCSLGEN